MQDSSKVLMLLFVEQQGGNWPVKSSGMQHFPNISLEAELTLSSCGWLKKN